MITNYINNGPGCGNPCFKLRGTKRQLIGWMSEYYIGEGENARDEWTDLANTGMLECIA